MSRRLLLLLLAAAAWVAAAPYAFAAEEGHDTNLLAIDWATAVAAIVVFLVLLVVLTKTAWKPILAGLQKREETIRKAVDDAAAASAKAQELVREYETKLTTARDEVRAILEEGRKDAEALRVRIEHEAQRSAADTSARAKRDIEQAATKAYDQVVGDVAAIAVEAAARIIGRRLDADGNAQIVDEVVRDFAKNRAGGRS